MFQGREKKERYNRVRRIILSMITVTKTASGEVTDVAVSWASHGMEIFQGEAASCMSFVPGPRGTGPIT